MSINSVGFGGTQFGQAVQNLNIMFGFPESSGLYDRTVVA